VLTREELIAALEPDEVDYGLVAHHVGAEALPLLPDLIDGDRPDIAAKAASLAGMLSGPGRSTALEHAARSPHPTVRIAAAAAAQQVDADEAERLVPLLLVDDEAAVRKLAVRAAAPVAGAPPVRTALDRVAADDPVIALRDAVAHLPGRTTRPAGPAETNPPTTPDEGDTMATDGEIVERAIAKFGPVIDLRTDPQTLIDIVRAARVRERDDAGLPPGGTPEPPGPTSMAGSEATLDDVMAEVLRLSRRLTEATEQITDLRRRLG
jgi:hypothetical protein